MYNLFIKKKLFVKYPYLPKSVIYNVQTLPEEITSGSGSYERNSFITVSTTVPNGYKFTGWTENGEVVSTKLYYTFIINSDRELVANFEENTYIVTTVINPTEGGSTTGSGTYTYGYNVTVNATPKTGYRFVDWTENDIVVSTNSQYSFIITKDRNLVANFSLLRYNISASINLSGAGTITGTGSYAYGSTAQLKATPNDGYKFLYWTENGNIVSTSDQYSFTVTTNRTLVANFEKEIVQYTITVNCDEGGIVLANNIDISNSSKSYDEGTKITLKASSNSGYKFTGWLQEGPGGTLLGIPGATDVINITVTKDQTFYAVFENQIEELSKDYLIFQALEDNCEISFNLDLALYRINLNYSIDEGNTWEAIDNNTVIINKNEYILFKKGMDLLSIRAENVDKIGTFQVTKKFKALGNLYCLITDDFSEDTVINENTPSGVFRELFKNCTTLQSVPRNFLFAKYIVSNIYASMFSGCTSLEIAPNLPAISSATNNYDNCYLSMFYGCTNLKTGPTISLNLSEILLNTSYTFANMFKGCNKLKSIEFNVTDSLLSNDFIKFGSSDGIFYNWVEGVNTEGTLTTINGPSYLNIFKNYKNIHGVPENWTINNIINVPITPGGGGEQS